MDSSTVEIHPTSIVEKGAELSSGVRIGPFCHVGSDVVVHENVELLSHVSLTGHTTIGAGSKMFPNAVVGTDPQNVAYKGEKTTLVVGKNTIIREGVTMHRGTGNARGTTVVGDNCIFLAYAHISHDSIIGNNVTFANNVLVGGHCVIGDNVIMGAGAGIHQFCTIGHHAFIGGIAAVANDVIPFGMVVGNRAHLAGLNLIGMKRSGMSRDDVNAMRAAYKALFDEEEGTLRSRAEALQSEYVSNAPVVDMLGFILADSKRKFITPITARKSRGDESV